MLPNDLWQDLHLNHVIATATFFYHYCNKTYYADNPNFRDVIIQQKLYHVNMANSAVRTTVRVKGTPMRAVLDTGANVSIMTLSIVKKLRLTMGMPDGSKIIAVD